MTESETRVMRLFGNDRDKTMRLAVAIANKLREWFPSKEGRFIIEIKSEPISELEAKCAWQTDLLCRARRFAPFCEGEAAQKWINDFERGPK